MNCLLFVHFFALIVISWSQLCKEDPVVSFESRQLSLLTVCPPLSREHCGFIHEAKRKCPCTCAERMAGIDPDGIGHIPAPRKSDGGGGGGAGGRDDDDGMRPRPRTTGPPPTTTIRTLSQRVECKTDKWFSGGHCNDQTGDRCQRKCESWETGTTCGPVWTSECAKRKGFYGIWCYCVYVRESSVPSDDDQIADDGRSGDWYYKEYPVEEIDDVIEEIEDVTPVDPLKALLPPEWQELMGDAGIFCFHGDMLLDTPIGQQTISDLVTVKDAQVLAWNRAENTLQYSPIKYWLHAKPDIRAPYLRIAAGDTNLLITGNHLIYRSIDCKNDNTETVMAHELKVGNCVLTKSNNTAQISAITSIQTQYKQGIYAPVTEQGSLVVNGVVASCFAENSNESLQKLINSYILIARNVLQSVMPKSWLDLVFGGDGDIPMVYWAFERFQSSFL